MTVKILSLVASSKSYNLNKGVIIYPFIFNNGGDMNYKLEINFTEDEREILTMLYGQKGVDRYINDLNATIELSFKLLMNRGYGVIVEGGDIN